MDRKVHYEVAFESYLQGKGWPHVAVDEAKKSLFGAASLKSFDFIVYSAEGPNLLAEVKGRKFPAPGKRTSVRAWENWVTREDVESMRQWEGVFGPDFMGMLVFAYWLQGPPEQTPFEDIHAHGGNFYAFVGIPSATYADLAKPRSARWQTITMPTKQFSQQASDIACYL